MDWKLVEVVQFDCFIGGIDLVKISDEGIEEEYDECDDLPCLVHFKYGKPPVTFYGDLKEDEEVQQWIDVEISKKRWSLVNIINNQLYDVLLSFQ